jgi:sarcosine oxidase
VIDVAVIGAGAMGSAAAWQLARRGRSVAVVEQFEAGHHRGSSHGVTRIFRLAYRDPTYVQLAVEALDGWHQLERASGMTLLEQSGQIDHGVPVAIDEIAANLEGAGFAAERMTPSVARRRWPGLRFDRAVVHSPDGGRIFAERTVSQLHRLATDLGAEISFGEPVVGVEPTGQGVVVHTDRRSIAARTVVVAAGAWVRQVVPDDIALPAVTVSHEVPTHFRPRDPSLRWPSFVHYVDGSAGGRSFGAYGLETSGEGVKVGVEDAASVDEVVDYVREWHPGLVPEPVSSTQCLFTNMPDEHFVIERHGPVVVCSPCSGHGFKFTPVVGALVADLCDGRAPRYRFGER